MPNGKHGDHPFTDILIHGSSEYGEPVDSLVKKLEKQANWELIKESVSELLWRNSPMSANNPNERISYVVSELRSLIVEE